MPDERAAVDEVALTGLRRDLNIKALLKLGLMVSRKWDRASTSFANPTAEQVAGYGVFTEDEVREFGVAASNLLRDYTTGAPKPSFWLPVYQGFLSAFLYSLFLILVALLARLGGHDLIDVLRDAVKP